MNEITLLPFWLPAQYANLWRPFWLPQAWFLAAELAEEW